MPNSFGEAVDGGFPRDEYFFVSANGYVKARTGKVSPMAILKA